MLLLCPRHTSRLDKRIGMRIMKMIQRIIEAAKYGSWSEMDDPCSNKLSKSSSPVVIVITLNMERAGFSNADIITPCNVIGREKEGRGERETDRGGCLSRCLEEVRPGHFDDVSK